MGSGGYSSTSRNTRAIASGYYTAPASQTFSQRNINADMNPNGVKIRESCDSQEHPNSVAIMVALDLTGSMGSIPSLLIRDGLPTFMDGIINGGIADPQVLFVGVGDHECDRAPLQVSQFESSDLLLDKWLTSIYLEGGGGVNDGESYHLAWYFAAWHTTLDCLEKRGQKGILFTIGDEPVLKTLPAKSIAEIMGGVEADYSDYDVATLLELARAKYHVFHIHVAQGHNGSRQDVMDGWKQIMGNNLIIAQDHKDIPKIMTDKILECVNPAPAPAIATPVKKAKKAKKAATV